MKLVFAVAILACLAVGEAQFTGNADIAARVSGDIANVTGYTRIRTLGGNQLFYESALNNAVQITAVHIHLQPQRGVVDGGPLVLALTNTSAAAGAAPLSSSGTQPLFQAGNVTNTNLAANPQIAAARAGIVALGINDNTLQNIGDIDRLLRLGVLYSDCHSTTRLSPNRVGSGALTVIGAGPTTGRKMI